MYRYADAFRCSRRNFLCFEESCRDLTQRPVRVDEKCLWREFSVFPYDGINTLDTVSQQYPELTKLCLRYFAQDKNTDSFRKQQAVPRFFSFRRFILENLRFLYRLQAGKNNKAAGLRARKVSLELEKKLKEFRKTSLAAAAK